MAVRLVRRDARGHAVALHDVGEPEPRDWEEPLFRCQCSNVLLDGGFLVQKWLRICEERLCGSEASLQSAHCDVTILEVGSREVDRFGGSQTVREADQQ